MRTIRKGVEPGTLMQYRRAVDSSYDNYANKEDLRIALHADQRGLCCYCLSRMRPDGGQMKIEHWHSQAKYPAEQLDYENLLGACKGGEGQSKRLQHCDTRKGDRDLSRNPANSAHRVEELVRFGGDGRVSSDDPIFDRELNDVLNLNLALLVSNRKAVLDAFIETLPSYGALGHGSLRKLLAQWSGDGPGELQPFCSVIAYSLRKRLARPQ